MRGYSFNVYIDIKKVPDSKVRHFLSWVTEITGAVSIGYTRTENKTETEEGRHFRCRLPHERPLMRKAASKVPAFLGFRFIFSAGISYADSASNLGHPRQKVPDFTVGHFFNVYVNIE